MSTGNTVLSLSCTQEGNIQTHGLRVSQMRREESVDFVLSDHKTNKNIESSRYPLQYHPVDVVPACTQPQCYTSSTWKAVVLTRTLIWTVLLVIKDCLRLLLAAQSALLFYRIPMWLRIYMGLIEFLCSFSCCILKRSVVINWPLSIAGRSCKTWMVNRESGTI